MVNIGKNFGNNIPTTLKPQTTTFDPPTTFQPKPDRGELNVAANTAKSATLNAGQGVKLDTNNLKYEPVDKRGDVVPVDNKPAASKAKKSEEKKSDESKPDQTTDNEQKGDWLDDYARNLDTLSKNPTVNFVGSGGMGLGAAQAWATLIQLVRSWF